MLTYLLGAALFLTCAPSFLVLGLLVLHLLKCGWLTFWETIPEEEPMNTHQLGSIIDGHVYLWRWRPGEEPKVLVDLVRKRIDGTLTPEQAVKVARDVRTVVEMEGRR